MMDMQKTVAILVLLLWGCPSWAQQDATIKEYERGFKTYPFSDPDPVPRFELIYPYYRFDGYTDDPIYKKWKVVELENEHIKVMVLPEIGGKIWTAIEKSTGKPFIYFNQVVKFRDIAMRGAWTSGGIEANYGIIGHTPNCSTPVDYKIEEKPDGSVSCYIGTLDLLTQTHWTIEINLPADKAYFTTRSFWHNGTPLEQPYYTWMNAGIKASEDLQFIYPGNKYVGHNGEVGEWPINPENGKDVSYYKNNDFGQYKSYHVFGRYTDFFGGYWHDEGFGMGRYAEHAGKPGKKIWIWGLSQQGMIWEKLLTDTDGQYVEVQSGRLFNQTAGPSTFTPFKHRGFPPYATDEWTEYWFPVKGTKGFVQANPYGALNASARDGKFNLAFSPLQNFNAEVRVEKGGKVLFAKQANFEVLKPFEASFGFSGSTNGTVVRIGDKVTYEFAEDDVLSRPVKGPENFDWNSTYGLWLQGKELLRARDYKNAGGKLRESLARDPHYLPALTDMALLMLIDGEYQKAFDYCLHALQIDTYGPAANYYYGLAGRQIGKTTDAKDGFDIALQSVEYRGAAATGLAMLYFGEKDYNRASTYANMALGQNDNNMVAYRIVALAHRKLQQMEKARETLGKMESLDPLNHFIRFEKYLMDKSPANRDKFTSMIRNEMPWESYLQLGIEYYQLGLWDDCLEVLGLSPSYPMVDYWIAFVKNKKGDGDFGTWIEKANNLSPRLAFPFRAATKEVLTWATAQTGHWKPQYYLGLVCAHAHQDEEAKRHFMACGDGPGFAPFYAARAHLVPENRLADLKKAASLDEKEWRYGKLLVHYYLDNGNTKEAVKVARQYAGAFPKNYIMAMLLAKALLLDGQFGVAGKILASTKILPYEGATESRSLYREAWLMQAVAAIKNKKYKDALSKIATARRWPENLGVGKPYDADIDDRLESYLESLCFEGMKKHDEAVAIRDKIVSGGIKNDYGNLLVAEIQKGSGKPNQGRDLLAAWLEENPSSNLAKWCLAAFDGNVDGGYATEDPNVRILKAVMLPDNRN